LEMRILLQLGAFNYCDIFWLNIVYHHLVCWWSPIRVYMGKGNIPKP
jgi:hypothetical protein